eukprot:7383574-Prymnesium_polylepis.2
MSGVPPFLRAPQLIEKVGVYQLTEGLAFEYLVERFRAFDADVPVTFTEITRKTVAKLVEDIQEAVIEQVTLAHTRTPTLTLT